MKMLHTLRLLLFILSLIGFVPSLFPGKVYAEGQILTDPNGFSGIQWGEPLTSKTDLLLIDPDERIYTFRYQHSPPKLANITVESIKLLSIDGQFARVMIRYTGDNTHAQIMNYLETKFGRIELMPGAMMRGLNQGYLWRGPHTEISLNYRGLGERGFVMFQSRILAPKFLDSHTNHSH